MTQSIKTFKVHKIQLLNRKRDKKIIMPPYPGGIFFTLDPKAGVVYNSTVEYWRRMSLETSTERDLVILEHIEQDPDITQADMASQLEVAVGTINWHIKRLIEKGYVKVSRAERKKLKYIITPEGIALRARLAFDYIQNQFNLYPPGHENV